MPQPRRPGKAIDGVSVQADITLLITVFYPRPLFQVGIRQQSIFALFRIGDGSNNQIIG